MTPHDVINHMPHVTRAVDPQDSRLICDVSLRLEVWRSSLESPYSDVILVDQRTGQHASQITHAHVDSTETC